MFCYKVLHNYHVWKAHMKTILQGFDLEWIGNIYQITRIINYVLPPNIGWIRSGQGAPQAAWSLWMAFTIPWRIRTYQRCWIKQIL